MIEFTLVFIIHVCAFTTGCIFGRMIQLSEMSDKEKLKCAAAFILSLVFLDLL